MNTQKVMTAEDFAKKAITDYYAQNGGKWSEDTPKGHTLSWFIEQALLAFSAQEAALLLEALGAWAIWVNQKGLKTGYENSLLDALTTYHAKHPKEGK